MEILYRVSQVQVPGIQAQGEALHWMYEEIDPGETQAVPKEATEGGPQMNVIPLARGHPLPRQVYKIWCDECKEGALMMISHHNYCHWCGLPVSVEKVLVKYKMPDGNVVPYIEMIKSRLDDACEQTCDEYCVLASDGALCYWGYDHFCIDCNQGVKGLKCPTCGKDCPWDDERDA